MELAEQKTAYNTVFEDNHQLHDKMMELQQQMVDEMVPLDSAMPAQSKHKSEQHNNTTAKVGFGIASSLDVIGKVKSLKPKRQSSQEREQAREDQQMRDKKDE